MEDILKPKTKQTPSPLVDFQVNTKKFVVQLLHDILANADVDPETLLEDALSNYVTATKTFIKSETYGKDKVEELLNQYVKRDGSKSFISGQKGIHPSSDYDLTTKKYVDELIEAYTTDADLDNFKLYVNNALNAKVKSGDVYKKSETYSRAQLNFTIQALVVDAAKDAINQHINDQYHLSTDDIDTYLAQYVKKSEQSGDYVTLTALNKILSKFKAAGVVAEKYFPHGNITAENGVGWITPDTELPESISYQDLFDLIFYNAKVEITIDDPYIEQGVDSTVCVHILITGITSDIDYIEILTNDESFGIYHVTDLDDQGKLEVCGIPVDGDTVIKVVVHYLNGTTKEDEVEVTAIAPIYVGLLPKWLSAGNIDYDILQLLVNGGLIDIEEYDFPIYGDSKNNWKLIQPVKVGDIDVYNKFAYDLTARKPFIMYPIPAPAQLQQMTSSAQAFPTVDVLTNIPITLPNDDSVNYTIYVYESAVTSLDTNITYTFGIPVTNKSKSQWNIAHQLLVAFYEANPEWKENLHKGLFKIVENDGNDNQVLYWVTPGAGDTLVFTPLVNGGDIAKLLAAIKAAVGTTEDDIPTYLL
ncbi:MAG: hypothetical protein EZS28_038240, partial [Streblomastix strix]